MLNEFGPQFESERDHMLRLLDEQRELIDALESKIEELQGELERKLKPVEGADEFEEKMKSLWAELRETLNSK